MQKICFVAADVLFAGAASPQEHSASLVVLRMAEITLIDAVASQQVIVEVERNRGAYFPAALPALRLLVSRCLREAPDPLPADLLPYHSLAEAIVYLDAPPGVALQRNRQRAAPAPGAVIERLAARAEPPDLSEAHVVELVDTRGAWGVGQDA